MAWSAKDYTPFFLLDDPTHTPGEIRREYSRMRDIAVKRASRLEKSGFKEEAQYIRDNFPTLKAMDAIIESIKKENSKLPKNKRRKVPQVGDYLYQGKSILDERSYSLSGIKVLAGLYEKVVGHEIKLGETLEFHEFMKSWRLSAFSNLLVPSGTAVELQKGEYQQIGGSFSDFYTLYKRIHP